MTAPMYSHAAATIARQPVNRPVGNVAAWLCVCALLLSVIFLVLALLPGVARSAYLVTGDAAQLQWQGAATSARANTVVTRFEQIGFYRYAPEATTTYRIWPGNAASPDSLSGLPPQALAALPPARRPGGEVIPAGALVPLLPAENVSAGETLFVVLEVPPLTAPSRVPARGTRQDGRRFMAVTVDTEDAAGNTNTFIITLIQESPTSERYIGYLTPSADTPLPDLTRLTLRYDDYGDMPDSLTAQAPARVSMAELAQREARKTAVIGQAAVVPESGLFLTKEILRPNVMVGDFVAYRVRAENASGALMPAVTIEDDLPPGFRYQRGSLYVDGVNAPDPAIGPGGRNLRIELGPLPDGASRSVRYVTEVTVAARPGLAVNSAVARAGALSSNRAEATASVARAFFDDSAFLMGRVIAGECNERAGQGVAGVRLYLQDGTNVVTDSQGRWHLEGVRPGTHVLQLDTETLSERYTLRACPGTSRTAGNDISRFVNVQGGTLWREDFYLDAKPEVKDRLQQRLRTDDVAGENSYIMTLDLATGDTRFDSVTTEVYLSADLAPLPGRARLDGELIADPMQHANHFVFRIPVRGSYWRHQLTLPITAVREAVTEAEKTLTVITRGTLPGGEQVVLQTRNRVSVAPPRAESRQFVLRPQFGVMDWRLPVSDQAELDDTIAALMEYEQLKITVTGHSDNVPIRPRAGRTLTDNRALGYARAQSVAEYIAAQMGIPLSDIHIRSVGEDEPVADNATAEGRALNRRVEIHADVSRRVSGPEYTVVEGDSGMTRSDAGDTASHEGKQRGMINLRDGMTLAQPVLSVNAVMDARLKPRLLLNGEPVPDSRIGMKMADKETGTHRYVWVGVQLFNEGDYRFELQGLDTFGNVRFSDTATVTLTGLVRHIRFAAHSPNSADGITPVGVKLALSDERNRPIETGTELRLAQSSGLVPLRKRQQDNPLTQRQDIVEVDANGYAWFEPVGNAGTYRIRLASGEFISDEIEVRVDPHLRDWILVGFAEGSVGYNTLSGNQSELNAGEEHLYTDGDMAFFARGRVSGEWLLTASYDSRRRRGDTPLGQSIDPEAWYVLYGDEAFRRHDAPTSDRLYVRMERRDFYALYGDFDTGMTVTELSRYSRTVTGAKTEYQGRHVSALGFASENRQGFIRDEMAGDGTSGLYRLSRSNIIPGSERITIEVRDRFTAELLNEQGQTRFIDYSIDYQSGTVFFRQPVPVQDGAFNPVRIVVEYETDQSEQSLITGGRVAVHDSERRIELGISGVHDDTTGARGSLAGADLTWKPNDHHTLRAERAMTRQDQPGGRDDGDAWLMEHLYTSERVDTRLHSREQTEGFGLGQQSATQDARRISGGDVRYRITEQLSLATELSRQEVLGTDNRRDLLETRAEYDSQLWGMFGGVRRAEDHRDNDTLRSDQLLAGAYRDLMEQRLRLSIRGETNINDAGDNTDYPSRLGLGADYRLTSRVSLFSAQEFSWNEERRTSDTRAGLRASPWQGGTISSELRQTHDEFGPRLFAHSGLYQVLDLGAGWSTDFGFDRAQTVRDSGATETRFDDERPTASGTARAGDYTAVFTGLGYRTEAWQVTSRLEHRDSDIDERWNFISGFHHRLDDADTLAGRLLHFYTRTATGERRTESAIEGSYVRRPMDADWFVLNRTRLTLDEQLDAFGEQRGTRITNNTVANFRPLRRHQLSLQYGARYVVDTIDEARYRGYTDLVGYEYRYDITERWDLGTRGSHSHSWNSGIRRESVGVMAGYSPVRDVWLSLGYNFRGFYDDDFDGAAGRMQGVVLDFRIKFDQTRAQGMRREVPDV
ncbi:OmpA family protein [Alcanivorax sp. JB21]|uniref:OmpA family protein n=1 Tax=Alcanivorax limicola TaxID=2874102 RepID=UPI001CBC1AA4|nr:OmpA family protein [Alcanivorax limicola]MBZ2188982.1 OmpA family protein [Alcanivorax limicola]